MIKIDRLVLLCDVYWELAVEALDCGDTDACQYFQQCAQGTIWLIKNLVKREEKKGGSKMTKRDFEVLARFAYHYDQEFTESLAQHLSASYANFNTKKFLAYIDKLRKRG